MLRLFVGLRLPENIKSHVIAYRAPLASLPGLRWTPPESLHITLKFLGAVEDKNASKIQSVLRGVAKEEPVFRLALGAGEALPGRRSARIWYAALTGDVETLLRLAGVIEAELAAASFPRETRSFRPHVTLARSGAERALPGPITDQFCTLFSQYSSPEFTVNEVHLIRSHLNPSGSRYETLETFPLRSS